MVASFLGGVGVAALRLRNNSIWPAIIAHMLNDFVQFITRTEVVVTTAPSPVLVTIKTLYPFFMFAYGLYLLRDEWRKPKLTDAS